MSLGKFLKGIGSVLDFVKVGAAKWFSKKDKGPV